MSFPAEGVELGFRNHIEDVRTFLDSRHPDHYTVFNLSPKSYRSARFHNRVSDFSPAVKTGRFISIAYDIQRVKDIVWQNKHPWKVGRQKV